MEKDMSGMTLAQIAHKYDAMVIVDAVTSLGGTPVMVKEWDLDAVYSVGDLLANSGQWPNWYPGNPFKAARDAMRPSQQPTATK